ncbi:MAG: T9SS type A sorting domain-containing protein [Bacteroidota bacterium]
MKKIYLTILAAAAFSFASKAQVDLSIGNLDAGFAYNSTTGIISDIYFSILSNENKGATNFKVGIYLVPKSATGLDDAFLLDSKNVPSISGNASIDVDSWTVDINKIEAIESGTYRLLVAVDFEKDISETDEDNNNIFISEQGDDLTYTKKGSSGIKETMGLTTFNVYPNPATEMVNLDIASVKNGVVTCNVTDLTGKLVSTKPLQVSTSGSFNQLDLSALPKGIYAVQLINELGSITKRIVKQ